MNKDKIIIDLADYPELAEFFSRREVGDSIKGRFEASLDECADNLATLSIDDIRLELGKEDKNKAPEGEEPAALKVMRGKKRKTAQADTGTDEEDSML